MPLSLKKKKLNRGFFCQYQEVERIRKEHPDDEDAVSNERVKGYLKVTRAFGCGFLKKVKA